MSQAAEQLFAPPAPEQRPAPVRLTSKDVLAALCRHHGAHRDWPMNAAPWAVFEELTIGVAWKCMSRIDLLAVRTGGNFERIAYEVKVSRSDLLRGTGKTVQAVPRRTGLQPLGVGRARGPDGTP